MAIFLSILRGINVGGQKMIKMQDLKSLYELLGFKNVTTYIQSGNVVFEYKNDKNLVNIIEQKIKEKFGFDVPLILRTIDEMKKVVEHNPFINDTAIAFDKLLVTYLSEAPTNEALKKVEEVDCLPDRFAIKGREIYVYCPNGYGKTKLNNTFFESKLKVKATTRNWKTTNELYQLLKTKAG